MERIIRQAALIKFSGKSTKWFWQSKMDYRVEGMNITGEFRNIDFGDSLEADFHDRKF